MRAPPHSTVAGQTLKRPRAPPPQIPLGTFQPRKNKTLKRGEESSDDWLNNIYRRHLFCGYHRFTSKVYKSTMSATVERKNSSPPGNCKFAIPKKGRLYEKVVEMLKGAGIEFRREARLDVALAIGLPITLVFLPAADIAKFVGEGNIDIGITGLDVVRESAVDVEHVMDLGFGACKLCVQAPVADHITNVEDLAGKRIVTSFTGLTKEFFDPLDAKKGVTTSIKFVGGSVEAACGLGLADAVVDLVETGTTMRVSIF